jgi:hypothetical protein
MDNRIEKIVLKISINEWTINTWRNVQLPYQYRKCKLKLYEDSILLLSEWLSSRKQATNACKASREKGPLYTVGGNVN